MPADPCPDFVIPEAPPIELPKIALCLPHYGQCSVGVIDAVLGAYSTKTDLYTIPRFVKKGSSFLPGGFNDCLARCLEYRDQGIVTHMAMIHADIVPDTDWLRTLWGELWFHRADVVSCVSPIKNPTGRTSTAVGNAADRWHIKRCLYLPDLETLPPTFGPEHVCGEGEVLLINTGLWLADLRRPWWDTFHFDTHSKIVLHPDGSRETRNRTEDWEWSYHLAENGARYLVTKRVRLTHEGNYQWPNAGTPFPAG